MIDLYGLFLIVLWTVILGIPLLVCLRRRKKKDKVPFTKKQIMNTFILFVIIGFFAAGLIGSLVVLLIFLLVSWIDNRSSRRNGTRK